MARLIAQPGGPFTIGPKKGYRRGIETYSAAYLPVVLRSEAELFRSVHGRYPELLSPERLSDKIFASKFLRSFKVPETGNKLLTSTFIPAEAEAPVCCPRVVWRSRTAKIPRRDELPPGVYYLKTNHGCDMYRRVSYPMSDEQANALDAEFAQYLKRKFGFHSANWWHNAFEAELMIETAIGSAEFPVSYNHYVIGGRVALLVPYQKLTNGFRKSYFDPDWTPLDEATPAPLDDPPSSEARQRMLDAAQLIGGPLGFARIDFLLDDDERPYLGEVTFTPGNALSVLSPDLDLRLGQMWDCSAMFRPDARTRA